MKRNAVILLCGEYFGALDEFQAIVCLSPIRHLGLARRNIASWRFSDFAPGEQVGEALDTTLYRDLDHCLHTEAREHSDSRWAPAAYLLIVYRLSRYLWVKRCLRNLVRRIEPDAIHLSSGADRDLVHACRAVAAESGIRLEVATGSLDATSAHVYLVRTYGLPRKLDPRKLRALRWRLTAAFSGKRDFLVQSYWNIDLKDRRIFWLSFIKALNISGRLLEKAGELLGLRGSTAFLDRPIELDDAPLRFARCAAWRQHFADDEIRIVDCLLRAFDDDFPAGFLDRTEEALIGMLRPLGVKRVVMIHDRLDACRVLAHAAHRLGIAVDYLPHGLIFEDFSGEHMASPFLPDRILAWNESSAAAFRRRGWQAVAVVHPQFRHSPRPFRPLSAPWRDVRVLVLVSDWAVASQASREDCSIIELAEVCEALARVGVQSRNIHAKVHSGTEASLTTKSAEIERLRQVSGLDFTIVDPSRRTTELMPRFDLVIFGLTTGLFEAVMLGIPAVVFGMSPARVGGLRPFAFPAAGNATDLVHVLERFDNRAMEQLYSGVIASLRSGSAIMAAVGAP
ncbi:MAG: hypothetical protein HY525_11665 [Betaproteobacteria bacterium]|nr:hypothetical protein [Betaproteobacteria bacterium]